MHDNLKLEAREKVVRKMTQDGAVEEHLAQKTEKRISQRAEDITFRAHEAGPAPAEVSSRRQTQKAFRAEAQEASVRSADGTEGAGTYADGMGAGETGAYADPIGAVTAPASDRIPENGMIEITEKVRQAQTAARHSRADASGPAGRSVSPHPGPSERTVDLAAAKRRKQSAQRYRAETAGRETAGAAGVQPAERAVPSDTEDRDPGKQRAKESGHTVRLSEHRSSSIGVKERSGSEPNVRPVQKKKQKRLYEEQLRQGKTKLQFEPEIPVDAKGAPIRTILRQTGAAAAQSAGAAGERAAADLADQRTSEVEDENSGVRAAREGERAAGRAAHAAAGQVSGRMIQRPRTAYSGARGPSSAEGSRGRSSRLRFTQKDGPTQSGTTRKSAAATGSRRMQAEGQRSALAFRRSIRKEQAASTAAKKTLQKQRIKSTYAALFLARHSKKAAPAAASAVLPGKVSLAMRIRRFLPVFVKKHKAGIAAALAGVLIIVFFLSASSTMTSMVSTVTNTVVETTYLGNDDDILQTEAAYAEREQQLQGQIDRIETDYGGYDEYRYQIDEITHDPYALTSYLSAKYGTYSPQDVEGDLAELFAAQYTLSLSDETEIRTRMVTQTVTDPLTGEESVIEVEETYEYRILNVVLTNQGLDAIVRMRMDAEHLNQYSIYQASLGNRSYLFGDAVVVGNVAGGGVSYEIPPEALTSDRFSRMIREAEKYLGYPYVWGGSSPSTSFDCSGFVSWVINHSGNGWNYGRQTAEGLRNLCAYVSPQDAEPGDLVFFKGTYRTSGASHVGIYVGNGMMIHCGKPIQYSSIETNYWRQHFYCFGRLP